MGIQRQSLVVIGTVSAFAVLAACDGLKEAFSAHQDVVARAASQELSVTRLADLMGNSKVPLNKNVAKVVADLWVTYQLLGKAAAQNDSFTDPRLIDSAMWSEIANAKAKKWYDQVSKTWSPQDSTANEGRYNQGEMLAAKHILLLLPSSGLTQHSRDSILAKAQRLAKEATPQNFGELAKTNSQDPGSAKQGGSLGVFARGQMVPEFEKGLLALKPGEISPVVQTQFGYHIIYRPRYAEVKDEFAQAVGDMGQAAAESTYLANLEKSAKVELKPDAPATAKAVAGDLDAHMGDSKVVATSTEGNFTAGRLAKWLRAFPARQHLPEQLATAPDSVIPPFIKGIVRNDLVLHQADSAKVQIDTADLFTIRRNFTGTLTGSWFRLGLDPRVLADSGKTEAERERVAAAHVEDFLDKLFMQNGQLVDVPQQIVSVLHEKYDAKVYDAGLDRSLVQAERVRAAMDSTRNANRPPSAVPMPGMVPGMTPGAAQPAPATKAPPKPATPTKKP